MAAEETEEIDTEKEPAPDILKLIVTAEMADLRIEPNPDSRILGQAPRETTLDSPGKTGRWYHIYIMPGNTELLGYIHEGQVMTEEEYEQYTDVQQPAQPERIPEKKLPQPEPKPSRPLPPDTTEKFYFKGLFGYGIGFHQVYLYMWTENNDKIYVRTGGGANIQAKIGYHILPALALEAGLGYQGQTAHPTVRDGGGSFGRMPISLSVLYKFLPTPKLQVYAGTGSSVYLGPQLTREGPGLTNRVKYNTALGIHGIAGLIFRPGKTGTIKTFFEITFEAAMYYKYKSATENGIAIFPFNPWREFKGDQIFFNFGVIFTPRFKR